jgi:hypothetical protein
MRGVFTHLHQDDLVLCVLVGVLSFFGFAAINPARKHWEGGKG